MDWNNNKDPFDDIIKQFFGEPVRRSSRRPAEFTQGEEEERVMDFIQSGGKAYLIFELPGFSSKDISVSVKNNRLEIKAQKKSTGNVQDYLASRLTEGKTLRKSLPQGIEVESLEHTYKNGILEVTFIYHG